MFCGLSLFFVSSCGVTTEKAAFEWMCSFVGLIELHVLLSYYVAFMSSIEFLLILEPQSGVTFLVPLSTVCCICSDFDVV